MGPALTKRLHVLRERNFRLFDVSRRRRLMSGSIVCSVYAGTAADARSAYESIDYGLDHQDDDLLSRRQGRQGTFCGLGFVSFLLF